MTRKRKSTDSSIHPSSKRAVVNYESEGEEILNTVSYEYFDKKLHFKLMNQKINLEFGIISEGSIEI